MKTSSQDNELTKRNNILPTDEMSNIIVKSAGLISAEQESKHALGLGIVRRSAGVNARCKSRPFRKEANILS